MGQCAFFSCRWNKINASLMDGTLFVATSVDATQSLVDSSWRWNKINVSSKDSMLFVATSVDAKREDDAMQRIVQREFTDFSWCWNKLSASSLDGKLL